MPVDRENVAEIAVAGGGDRIVEIKGRAVLEGDIPGIHAIIRRGRQPDRELAGGIRPRLVEAVVRRMGEVEVRDGKPLHACVDGQRIEFRRRCVDRSRTCVERINRPAGNLNRAVRRAYVSASAERVAAVLAARRGDCSRRDRECAARRRGAAADARAIFASCRRHARRADGNRAARTGMSAADAGRPIAARGRRLAAGEGHRTARARISAANASATPASCRCNRASAQLNITARHAAAAANSRCLIAAYSRHDGICAVNIDLRNDCRLNVIYGERTSRANPRRLLAAGRRNIAS